MTVTKYVPPAVAHLGDPPTFRLREPRRSDREAYAAEVQRAGAKAHPPEEFRAEAERALRELWHFAIVEAALARLRSMWATIDAGQLLSPTESAELEGLGFRLESAWPPLREMAQANRRIEVEVPRRAIARLLIGWQNVPLEFRRGTDGVPLTLIARLESWLSEAESAGKVARLQPGAAFHELVGTAVHRLVGDTDAAPFTSTADPLGGVIGDHDAN